MLGLPLIRLRKVSRRTAAVSLRSGAKCDVQHISARQHSHLIVGEEPAKASIGSPVNATSVSGDVVYNKGAISLRDQA